MRCEPRAQPPHTLTAIRALWPFPPSDSAPYLRRKTVEVAVPEPEPPPDRWDRNPGYKVYPAGQKGTLDDCTQRYWNGEDWEGPVVDYEEALARQLGVGEESIERSRIAIFWASILYPVSKVWVMFGLLIISLVVMFLLWNSGGDDEAAMPEAEEPAAVGTAAPESGEEGPAAAAGPPEAGGATAGGADDGPSGTDCEPRTFRGTVTVSIEDWPVGAAVTSEARFVIDAGPPPDTSLPACRPTADLVWLGSGTDARFQHERNPSGSFCSILLGEEGDTTTEPLLNWTPDGSGGGTLEGTMFVRGSVGFALDYAGFAQTCPPVEDALQFAFPWDPPIVGQFTATVADGTLTGSGTFADPRAFTFTTLAPPGGIGGRGTYSVEVNATETSG